MRTKVATVVLALSVLVAAPAALAQGSVTIDARLTVQLGTTHSLAPVALTARDRMASCQVGASRKRLPHMTEAQRKTSVVACEQPPRSDVNVSNGLKAAEASALVSGG